MFRHPPSRSPAGSAGSAGLQLNAAVTVTFIPQAMSSPSLSSRPTIYNGAKILHWWLVGDLFVRQLNLFTGFPGSDLENCLENETYTWKTWKYTWNFEKFN